MTQIQDIYNQYLQLRIKGQDAKVVLDALRSNIEGLEKAQRAELATMLRAWEASSTETPVVPPPAAPPPMTRKSSSIKPIVPVTPVTANAPVTSAVAAAVESVEWVTCPNCGKGSQRTEVFCYACGQLLEPISVGDTRHFNAPDNSSLNSEYFGIDSVLALRVRGSSDAYETRPQKSDHEIIVGRSTTGSAMSPDIDLNPKGGADLGVSRLHLSIRYNPDQQSVLVTDLSSANGSFLNGQRMLSKEVRVLRHGDELRLGKLVMIVSFRHPSQQEA